MLPGTSEPIAEETILWVRWNAAALQARPRLEQAIADFDPGSLPAAQAAARWLRADGLGGESQPYLAVVDDEVVGFYALTVGQVILSSHHRKKLDLTFSTQGAVLLTWIAKSARHKIDGGLLVTDAIGVALEIAAQASATVFALDPYDEPTAEMWKSRYAMRESQTELKARDGEPVLRRLYVPLSKPAA
ncbi:hypothetical protein DSM104299_04456 [Baekduia alba]|uniref:hypothetical protein n=1 Tax=Baekduia alba TaxID=2997333 RepID=UPI00233FE73F|nr:hypothetical protein [Baekduia alba]WCB95707.1 hypothetical protein DSM104299_04456 [Baekduia alba]